MPPAGATEKLGIFGGTFDPPHTGHLIAAQDVFEALSLDRLLFVPARRSPTKEHAPEASGDARLRMVSVAIEGDSRFRVSDIELDRGAPSYTIDTLQSLAEAYPHARLVLLIGADQWADFSRWREPGGIAALAELALMTRLGDRPSEVDSGLDEAPNFPFTEVPVTRVDVSSSLVRSRVRVGRSIRYLVPEPVRRIIEADNLYVNES